MWKYKGVVFTDSMIPEGAVGFIYEITVQLESGVVRYIGKKNFYSDIKTKLGKKESPIDKRKKDYQLVRRYTYANYYSSNEEIKRLKANGCKLEKEILRICFSKTELTYQECRYLFGKNVLDKDEYLNSNILGKFYKTK
jgi:hypothetical protein